MQAIETQRQVEEELKSAGVHLMNHHLSTNESESSQGSSSPTVTSHPHSRNTNDHNHHRGSSSVGREHPLKSSDMMSSLSSNPKGLMESKIQYIRQMVFQYLSCKDNEVKSHIESALMTLLRFNDLEKSAIENRKQDESQDALTAITSFLGSTFSV